MKPIATLLVPALAAPGRGQHDHRRLTATERSPRARARPRRADAATATRSAADAELTQTSRRTSRSTARATSSASTHATVVRTEPRDWVTNFETNYLAAIDFYDEDFPWRYTPAAPDAAGLQLRPWLALVVLAESEFSEATNSPDGPLPYISVTDAKRVPAGRSSCGRGRMCTSTRGSRPDGGRARLRRHERGAAARLQSILDANPDVAYSRCSARAGSTTTPATTPS